MKENMEEEFKMKEESATSTDKECEDYCKKHGHARRVSAGWTNSKTR